MSGPIFEEEIAIAKLDDPNVQADHHLDAKDIARLTIETSTARLPGKREPTSLPWQRYTVSLHTSVTWPKGAVVRIIYPRHGLAEGKNTILAGSTEFAGKSNLSLIAPRYWTDENGKSTGQRLTTQHLERMRRGVEPFGPNAGKKKSS